MDADRKKFHEECRFMYKQYGVGESDEAASQAAAEQVSTFPMPVKINVGGKTFQTTMMTLQGKHAGEQESMLAAMFSGRHPNCLDEGIVFIDRDGDQFAHLMEYLRSPTGKMGYFQNLRNKHLQALREAKRDLEYEQMLEEARYFQLQGVLALLLPPAAWFGRDSTYGVLQAPESPAAGDVITWKWEHHAGLSNAELYALEEDGAIRFVRAGTFLIMAKVPGVSANNSGCGQLVFDGTVTDECWSGDQHGDNNMLYFNRVMAIAPGGRLQVQGRNLSHGFNLGSVKASSLYIVPLRLSSSANMPFVSLRMRTFSSSAWFWEQGEGSDTLLDVRRDDPQLTFTDEGCYLVMARVSGVSSNNNGYAQLNLNDKVVGESWAGDASGYNRMLYFVEVLETHTGDKLQLTGINLSHGISLGRKATDLTVVRLGSSSDVHARYAQFSSLKSPSGSGFWSWTIKQGSSRFIGVDAASEGTAITFQDAGRYLVTVRVPGHAQLVLDGTPVQESYANKRNGYHVMLHFNEVLKIAAGGTLQLQNVNLSHSFNLGRPEATTLTAALLEADK